MDFDEIAERIIRKEVADFVATDGYSGHIIAHARDALKKAIVDALEKAAKEEQCRSET